MIWWTLGSTHTYICQYFLLQYCFICLCFISYVNRTFFVLYFFSLMCHFGQCISVVWVQVKLMKLLQRLPASVVRRLHRERYKKPCWITPIPSSHRLTDANITEFVESMKQPVLMAMFSKTGSMDAAQALQNLALMRPELVIPPVLEKWVPHLDTVSIEVSIYTVSILPPENYSILKRLSILSSFHQINDYPRA